MRTRYFDTEEFAISKTGVVLRLRAENEEYVLVLKTDRLVEEGLHQRLELSVSADSDLEEELLEKGLPPDIFQPLLENSEDIDDEVYDVLALARCPLQIICSANFTRTCVHLGFGDSLLELSIDEGTLSTDRRTEPFAELEIELKEGSVQDLIDFGRGLRAGWILPPGRK